MDRIQIEALRVRCILGVDPEERREKQEVLIWLELGTDFTRAAQSDLLNDAVDYRALKKKIVAQVENSHYSLLETLAVSVAEQCLENPEIVRARVRIKKPGILRFAKSVGVEVERENAWNRACVSMGSNLEPEENFRRGLALLSQSATLLGFSTVFETRPETRPEQPWFLNAVVLLQTRLSPLRLKFEVLRAVESQVGRIRGQDKDAARTLDLDILIQGSRPLDLPDLILPDPVILRRPYLAAGLRELVPQLPLPGWNMQVRDLPAVFPAGLARPLPELTQALRKEFIHES